MLSSFRLISRTNPPLFTRRPFAPNLKIPLCDLCAMLSSFSAVYHTKHPLVRPAQPFAPNLKIPSVTSVTSVRCSYLVSAISRTKSRCSPESTHGTLKSPSVTSVRCSLFPNGAKLTLTTERPLTTQLFIDFRQLFAIRVARIH